MAPATTTAQEVSFNHLPLPGYMMSTTAVALVDFRTTTTPDQATGVGVRASTATVPVMARVMAQDLGAISISAAEGVAKTTHRTHIHMAETARSAILVSFSAEHPSRKLSRQATVAATHQHRSGPTRPRRSAWSGSPASASRAPSSSATLPCVLHLSITDEQYETVSTKFRADFEQYGEIREFFDVISRRGMVFVTFVSTSPSSPCLMAV